MGTLGARKVGLQSRAVRAFWVFVPTSIDMSVPTMLECSHMKDNEIKIRVSGAMKGRWQKEALDKGITLTEYIIGRVEGVPTIVPTKSINRDVPTEDVPTDVPTSVPTDVIADELDDACAYSV